MPADNLAIHDGESDSYAASFALRTVTLLAGAGIEALSWWAFSLLFEEKNPEVTRHLSGGDEFGGGARGADASLLTVSGVPMPSYRVFQMLKDAGSKRLPVRIGDSVDGIDATLSVLATSNLTSSDAMARVYLANFAPDDGADPPTNGPRKYNETRTIVLHLLGLAPGTRSLQMEMINATCCNPKSVWETEMGSVAWPAREQLQRLQVASKMCVEDLPVTWSPSDKMAIATITLEAYAAAALSVPVG